jgi:hypothetical protein
MLEHAFAAMTLDTYADLFDDDLDSVAMRLSQAAMSTDVVGKANWPLLRAAGWANFLVNKGK